MDSYEKRSDAYDRFFDKEMDKLCCYEEKLDNDMHPDKKIKLYKELIDRAHAFYMECLAKESADSELYHNSNEAYSQYEYYQKEYEDFISRYDEELAEWEEDQEVKKEEQKCKRMIAQYEKKILSIVNAATKKTEIVKQFPAEDKSLVEKAIKQLVENGKIKQYKEKSRIVLAPPFSINLQSLADFGQ